MDKKKILIVENEELIAKANGDYLTKFGYDVSLAYDGEEGLKQVKIFKPDLITLDLLMPKLDGLAFLKLLRADAETAEIPVIMLTNISTNESVLEAMTSGVTHYLIKADYGLEDLRKKIEEIIG